MTDRKVKAVLELDTSGFSPAAVAASKDTKALTAAQKEAEAAAKAAGAAQREAAVAAKDAAAEAAAAAKTLSAAQKDATAAAKDTAAADAAASKAATDEQKEAAAAAQEAAAARSTSATEAVAAAEKQSAAAAEVAASEKAKADAARVAATAARESATAAKEAALADAAAAKEAEDAAKKRSDAYTNTGKKMLVAGAVLVGAFAEAEKATTDFDVALSGVQAVSDASAADMAKMSAAALQAGKDTAFTATQAADAEGELVKAGVSTADILGGALTGALSLAAAGQLDLADAATISANAMNVFNLRGKDVGHIADVLAAGANTSAADVKDLAYGLQQGGLVAAQTGLTLEDTTAVLAAFADRGLKGADAGTSMKTMLEKLNAPTAQAAALMDHLGITTYDASGKFVGISSLAGQLHDKLSGLTDAQRNSALATIFGSDAIRGATVLYNLGATGMQGYIEKVNQQGAASDMAAAQMNNLSGDLKQLKGSIDVALIGSGSGANSVLRDMTQEATKLTNAFTALPKWLQEASVGMAGGAGSALLLVGGLTSLGGKVGATRKTLQELATTAEGMKGVMASGASFLVGPWGLALAGAGVAAAVLTSHIGEMKIEVTDFTSAIKEDGNALGDHTVAAVAADLASKGLYDTYGKLGVSQDTLTQAAMGNAAAMDAVSAATGKALKAGTDSGDLAAAAKQLATIHATADGLHKQLTAQQQATAATEAGTAASKANTAQSDAAVASAKDLAEAQMQRAGALRALADASTAAADTHAADVEAVQAGTAATSDNTAVTNAATTAKHSQTAADKSATLASRDATKAAADHAKANDASAKAAQAAADASKVNASATATAAEKKKAAATATRDAAAATRAATTASDADTRASDASATAADKAGRAHDAAGKAADAKAKSVAAAAKASKEEADAQQAAAEAAAEAAFEHQIGTAALQAWAGAAADTRHATDVLDAGVSDEVAAMKDAKDKADGLRDALDALNGVHIQAGKAAIDVQGKIADLTKAFHDNGTNLDITTDKGRKNMGAIYDLAAAINTHAQAVVDETGSVYAGNTAMQASRDEFDKVLAHAGLTTQQIKNFNDTLLNTPKLVPVAVDVAIDGALQKLREFHDKATGLVTIQTGSITTGTRATFSRGGRVVGPGTPTSDSVPIDASRDEYVLNAAAASAIGYANLDRWNAAHGGTAGAIVSPQISQVGGTTPHPAAAAASAGIGAVELRVAPGADQAVATLIMNLVRTGKLQLAITS